ncbi:Endopolyphosphatase, partial [Lobosporangium transversale]
MKHQAILLLGTALACCLANAATTEDQLSSSSSYPFGRFLHITDIHPDENYINGGAVSRLCHTIAENEDESLRDANVLRLRWNRYSTGARTRALTLQMSSDQAYKRLTTNAKAQQRYQQQGNIFSTRSSIMEGGIREVGIGGYYGAPNTICDTPLTLADAVFNWIDSNLSGSIDFIVWTGDNARHDSDNTFPRTQEQIFAMNFIMARRMLTTFPPNSKDGERLPIVPSIGNNDVYPHNIMFPGPNPILDHYLDIWSEFIPENQKETFRKGGYYSKEVIPGKISVFGLNTLYFYIQNTAVDGCKKKHEPGTKQMDWLQAELKSLRKRGMVAYLTGHVPPEKHSYTSSCHSRYTQLAIQYQDVIVGHLYGHANIDHFFILSQAEDRSDKDDSEDSEEEDENRLDVMNKIGGDPFLELGLTSYLEALWEQYKDISKKSKGTNYAAIQVSPSIVPSYQPTLRVFTYELANDKNPDPTPDQPQPDDGDDEDNDEDQDEEEDGHNDEEEGEEEEGEGEGEGEGEEEEEELGNPAFGEYFNMQLNNNVDRAIEKKKHKKHKKHKKTVPRPAPVDKFGYPLGFTQYWANLTQANEELTPPEFVVEYRTREDYGLQHLGVTEWLGLARRITEEKPFRNSK